MKQDKEEFNKKINYLLSPLKEKGYHILLQPINDGFLIHLYIRQATDTANYIRTVKGPTLQDAVDKVI